MQIADTGPNGAAGTLMIWNLHGLRNKGDACQNITPDGTGNTQTQRECLLRVFWGVKPCNWIEVYRRFDGTYSLHVQGKKTEGGVRELM